MFKHISHVSLAQYFRTKGLACFVCTSIFVGKILTSMCDCCKSIFKLVMNNWSIVLMVLIFAQTCTYISSHTFYCFCLQNSTNVNLKMKRDNELQKPSHILLFDQEKGKATCIENVLCPKAKGLFIKLKYQKFQASISK